MRLEQVNDVIEIDRLAFPTPTRPELFRYEISQNKLAHYQVLSVLEKNDTDKIIGFAGYWMMADEAHISTIAVSPTWQGLGLGELLLLNMLFLANDHGAQMATLEVRQTNQVAQALYQKCHFGVVGRRRRYYHDTGEDAVLMTASPLDARYYQKLEQNRDALFTRLKSQYSVSGR